jgi:hypothetical protein
MANELIDVPTDTLLQLVVAILEVGKPLNYADGEQLEKLGCELQRRMETHGWIC